MVTAGDAVVVTVNFRVGYLGFFAYPQLDAEGHVFGNYGTMDEQMALRWVQRNIAKFGGDPHHVTIFGQSGGATAVMVNLVSPLSKGLFQRIINESGTHITAIPLPGCRAARRDDRCEGRLRQSRRRDGLHARANAAADPRRSARRRRIISSIDGKVVTGDPFETFRIGRSTSSRS